MLSKTTKFLFLAIIIGALIVFLNEFSTVIIESLYYLFAMMFVLTIGLMAQGDGGYAIITLLLGLSSWFIFIYLIMYRFVFNILFPKVRIVDELKNNINYARKVKISKGEDPRFVYLKIKFKLFPVFRWHTFKVPKPEYQGLYKKIAVKNGVPGVIWRRMPSSIDIVTKELNIKWNEKENSYELTVENLPRIEDDVNLYRSYALETIHRLSGNITEAIRGDSDLLKDKYQMGMPLPTGLLSDKPEEKKIKFVKDIKNDSQMYKFIDGVDS